MRQETIVLHLAQIDRKLVVSSAGGPAPTPHVGAGTSGGVESSSW